MYPMMTQRPYQLLLVTISVMGLAVSFTDLTAQEKSQRAARDFFINGTSLQIQGNRHAEAILEFQQALRHDSSAATLAAIARSYLELRKVDLALEHVEAALLRDPQQRDYWELKAEILVMHGKYDQGIEAFEHLLTMEPTRRQLLTLARLYEPRNAQKAIAIYERLSKTNPETALFMRLADLYERIRDRKQLRSALERAINEDPQNPQLSSRLAEVLVSDGDFGNLRVLLSKWTSSDGDLDRSSRVWGVALSKIAEDSIAMIVAPNESLSITDDVSERFPEIWPLQLLAATVASLLDDTVRAHRHFQLAVHAGPGVPAIFLEIGRLNISSGRSIQAIDYVQDGAQRFPTDPRFPYMLGTILQELGRYNVSLVEYGRAIQLDPTLVDAWVQVGLVYDILDSNESSDYAYEKALRIDPNHSNACNNFAYSLATRNIELARARTLSWKAVSQEPGNSAFLDTYAWVLFLQQDYDQAHSYIQRAISVGGNATHYEHLGDILEARGDVHGAVKAWQTSLSKDPQRTSVKFKIDRFR